MEKGSPDRCLDGKILIPYSTSPSFVIKFGTKNTFNKWGLKLVSKWVNKF